MKKILILIAALIVVGVAYYTISPLFNTLEVNDELPPEVLSGVEQLTPEQVEEMEELMEAANQAPTEAVEDSAPVMSGEPSRDGGTQGDLLDDSSERFPIQDTFGHPAEGTVRVINVANGSFLRFENFETINGPQLHLYLAKDLEATEYIDLGPIRGTKGNINYEVPADVDLSEYRYVMHWCVPFSVLFNYAELDV